jgi:hypothetical protein
MAAADKSKITDSLWQIVESETARLLAASKSPTGLDAEGQEALANMARVARTLSLHNPGEDAFVKIENAEDLRKALELLQLDADT